MKQGMKKTLAILLALVLCAGLLPASALADDPADVTLSFENDGPVLYEDGSVSAVWTYSSTLPEGSYMPEVFAWTGTSTEMPSNGEYWIMTASDARADGGSYVGGLYWCGNGDAPTLTTGQTCTLMIEVMDTSDYSVAAKYGPAQATVTAGSAIPEPVAPVITSASYSPVSTVLTATFTTTDLYAGYYESYLLTKKSLMSDETQGTMTIGEETYNQWGFMSFDAGDSEHVAIDRAAGTVTLSQDLAFNDSDNYFTYPKTGDVVYVVVETANHGKSDVWALTVPETGDAGPVSVTVDSIEDGTMTTDFGTTLTGKIATLSVTMEREDGVMAYFIAPFNSNDMKAGTGNMPQIKLEKYYNNETHTWEFKGGWEGTTGDSDLVYEGPNGETVTVTDETITAEIKVCQSSDAQNEVVFAEGDSIVIYAAKTNKSGSVSSKEATLEIPFSASSVGQSFTVGGTVAGPKITTATLAGATELTAYSATLAGSAGADGALSWAVTQGALPSGLTLSSDGTISGTPGKDTAGSYSFTVTLTEAGVETGATKALSLRVSAAAAPTITTETLPNASTEEAYTATLSGTAAVGGTLSWAVASGSALPGGLTLSSDGVLSGQPTQEGSYSFTLTVTEQNSGKSASQSFSLVITGTVPEITTIALPAAVRGAAYTATLAGAASKGGALHWSLKNGSALPAGLALSDGGVISGTPGKNTADSNSFTVKLSEEGVSEAAERSFTLALSNPANPTITTATLADAKEAKPYSAALEGAASIDGTLSWSVTDGALPEGLTLSSAGALTGTAAEGTTGDFSFTVTLTETKGDFVLTAEKRFTLTVNAAASYTISYALNGGAAAAGNEDLYGARTVLEGTQITLPAAPARKGYAFDGWRINGTTYDTGAALTLSANLNACAQWTENPVTVTFDGQTAGYVSLRGVSDGRTYYLDSNNYSTLTAPTLTVRGSDLERTYTSLELYASVDGMSYLVADYTGDIDGQTAVALTKKLDCQIVTGLQVTGLTAGTDYEINYMYANGWSVTPPFLTKGKGVTYSVRLKGVEASASYEKYDWGKSYSATLSDGVLTVAPDPVPDGVYVTGTVKFGSEPLAGAQVLLSQYVYGQNRNVTVTTDAQGRFTTEGTAAFLPERVIGVTVLSDGQQVYSDYANYLVSKDGDSDFTADTPLAVTFNAAVALLSAELDLSASATLTAAQKADAEERLSSSVSVRFTDEAETQWYASGYATPGQTRATYLQGAGKDTAVRYSLSGRDIADQTGSFTLSDVLYRGTLTLKPNPAVLAYLRAPIWGQFAFGWFDGSGACVGVSNLFEVYDSVCTVLSPCPAKAAGTYTVVLIPASATGTMTTLGELRADNDLHRWTVTLAANEIKALESGANPFTLSQAASENAAYVTKPNSTLFADRESFATSTELVRFTGSIGLDEGLSGKLSYLKISPKNVSENISYSNTATVQYVVLNGKVYTAGNGDYDFQMSGTGYYYKDFGTPIELPCDYTIYCKPGSADWDMQLAMYANVQTANSTWYNQLIGQATVKKPGAYITTLSSYVCDETIAVNGVTAPNKSVYIYDGETLIATATANALGKWRAKVTLAGTDSEYASTHVLTSRTDNARSEDLYVFHDPAGPQLTSFTMKWAGNNEINVGDGYTYRGSMSDLTFKAAFKNPDKLRATEYGKPNETTNETAKVAFVYYLTNGTIATVYGSEQAGGVFTATLPTTLYSSVAAAEVLFDPILNNRPAQDGVYALTATDLAEYAGALDAAKDATLFSDAVNLSRTADADKLATVNAGYAGTGMEVRDFAVEYDDETGFLQWMNDSAAEWTSGNPEANTVGIYNKSVVFADKADYDARLARLKAYATWQSALENKDSSVTGGQLFFTDMEYDGDLNLTDEGSYIAEFNAFCDTGRELYVITGALALDSSFQGYAADLPNDEEATLMWSWGNEASKRDNVSTTEKALMKYVQDGGIQKLFSLGPPNPVVIYNDIHNNATEHIQTTAQSEMQALGAKVDAGMIENSKEFQEVQNAKSYYDSINPFSSFRSSGYESDKPTIGDRIDQIKKDIEALKAIDGKLPSMDAKFALEMMKSFQDVADLGSALTGGADLNPTSPLFKFLQDVPGIVCDKLTMDQIQERMEIYNRLMYNWNYVQNWYNSEIGFGDERFAPKENNGGGETGGGETGGGETGGGGTGGGETGGGVKDDTGTSSGSRAREIADQSKTRKPPITNKVNNDPAGIVFEGVLENPVEGATVTLYYAATDGGDLVTQDMNLGLATQLLPADGVNDLIPDQATQTTGADGRYSWGVPEGLWFVTAEYGGLTGNSDADTAAKVAKAVGAATQLLPVLPVQLNVNIPIVDTAPPTVSDVRYVAGEGVYVTYSKFMTGSVLSKANYAVGVTKDGVYSVRDDVEITAVVSGQTPDNLGPQQTYTKTVLIAIPGLAADDAVDWTVAGTVQSYAGTALGGDYRTASVAETKEQLAAPQITANGQTVASGATVTVRRGDGVILSLPDGAPANAKLRYQTGSEAKDYTAPIPVSDAFALIAWVEAPGYEDSAQVTATFKLPAATVTATPTLTASPTSVSVYEGSTAAVTLTELLGTDPVAGVTVTAVSSDASVATVTASAATGTDGKASFTVTGVKAGSATITFTVGDGTLTASVAVTVSAKPAGPDDDDEPIIFKPNVIESLHGSVSVKPSAPQQGDLVTVTVTPDEGYELDTLSVCGAKGNAIELTENEDGTYSFVQGVGVATIQASFKETPFVNPFKDVEEGKYYYDAVMWAYKNGITEGTGEDTFSPKRGCTRAQMVTFLWRAAGKPEPTITENPFSDVAEGAYYYDAVLWAYENGITLGTGGGKFSPDGAVTRAQTVTFLFRALSGKAEAEKNPFNDLEEGSYYFDAVLWAAENSITLGTTPTTFSPDSVCIRAQIVTFLYRAYGGE